MSTPGATGYTPAEIRAAYGFNQVQFDNGTVAGSGQGTTIAIVDAYDNPDIASDLHQFDLTFGLPDPVFTEVNQTGGSALPAANATWATEIALDVEWAHAIAPAANILLVEANSNWFSDLFAAVDYARNAPGVVAVSMSWGSGEYAGESASDSLFTTPTGHSGVTFLTSAGDQGAPIGYPGASPNVVSVGGTTLNETAGVYGSESGWSGSGGGVSAYETQPAYQNGVVTQSTTFRANPDVSFDSDPNTGFPVYDTYNNPASTPWNQWGGTSDATPQWAGLIAIADQGRALAGLGSLDGGTQTLPKLYSMPASAFHDVTSGTSTGTPNFAAGAGFDLVTGRGTPYADAVVSDLIGQPTAPTVARFVVSAPSTTTAGSTVLVTVTAVDGTGHVVTGYDGTVRFASSDASAVLPSSYTFTTADAGRHTFSLSLRQAGIQTVAVSDTVGNLTATATLTVSPGAPARLRFVQVPTTGVFGRTLSPAVIVDVLDAYGNLVTTDNSGSVTLSFANDPTRALLMGATTASVRSGVATFGTLAISLPGMGYTLEATAPKVAPTISSAITISTGAIWKPLYYRSASVAYRSTAATSPAAVTETPSSPVPTGPTNTAQTVPNGATRLAAIEHRMSSREHARAIRIAWEHAIRRLHSGG